jgi:hypothetical protein
MDGWMEREEEVEVEVDCTARFEVFQWRMA